MTLQSQETSIRYHIHCIGVILSNRILLLLHKHHSVILAFAVGLVVGVGSMVTYAYIPQLSNMIYDEPLTTSTIVPLADTDTDTLDTEIFGNLTSGFNLTGRIIATNEPVNNFECRINYRSWGNCYIKDNNAVETLEIRAVKGTEVDNTPAVWMRPK